MAMEPTERSECTCCVSELLMEAARDEPVTPAAGMQPGFTGATLSTAGQNITGTETDMHACYYQSRSKPKFHSLLHDTTRCLSATR